MNRLFGSSGKKPPKATLDDTIKVMDTRTEGIDEKIRKLDCELAGYRERLSKMPEGPAKASLKQQAMRALQQRKAYDAHRAQIQSQTFNLEQTQFATDNLKHSVVMVDSMRQATTELKSTMRKMGSIDRVHDLRDEMEDLMVESSEISELMSRSYNLPDGLDEADLEQELDGLLESELYAGEPNAGSLSYLEVSQDKLASSTEPVRSPNPSVMN